MDDQQLQKLIDEAKEVQKEYPYFEALAEARSGALWRSLSKKQRKFVQQALMPRDETGITVKK